MHHVSSHFANRPLSSTSGPNSCQTSSRSPPPILDDMQADSENSDIRTQVREMLDKALKISAELVHMGLLQVPVCCRSLL